MAADRSEVAALARAFARHLEHLREFAGVHYVGAGPLPSASEGDETDDQPYATPDAEGVANAREGDVGYRVALREDARTSEPVRASEPARASEPVRASEAPQLRTQAEQWTAAAKLAYLRERNVGNCQRCPLAKTRSNIVFGVGDPDAALMFVGEAPGADEDRLGEPFVGAAGKRLDQWLHTLGLARTSVYIANVIKCRPPNNRDPQAGEIERCSPFLHAQIRAIRPQVLVALGRYAAGALLGMPRDAEVRLGALRGKVHTYVEPKAELRVPVVVTYHPSYVLRRDRETTRAGAEQGGAIKSEDEKVLDDLRRALSLVK
jgi:DNA polymerase